MAIANLEIIRIGAKNQAVNSDSLYDAFYKIKNNFASINNANVYTNFVAGNGIDISANSSNSTITIVNDGVTQINAGTGIGVVSSEGGIVTISSNVGNTAVTSVGATSNTLLITNSPITSTGNITINLPTTGVTSGSYVFANIVVDEFGRITSISNGSAPNSTAISNGTSSVSIPTINGNVILAVNGGNTLIVSSNNITANSSLNVQGNISSQNSVNSNTFTIGNTSISHATITTTNTITTVVVEIPVSNINGAKFIVKGVDSTGGKYSMHEIMAVSDGVTANYIMYGNINVGGYPGLLNVGVANSNIQLKVTPSSNNSTVWTTQYQTL